jgi:hypothetical protein
MSEFLSFLYWTFYFGTLGSSGVFLVWMIVMLFIGHRYDGDDGRGT